MSLWNDARFEIGRLTGRFLSHLLRNVQPRVIYDGDGLNPYLSRYYVVGRPTMPDGSSPFDQYGNPKPDAKWAEGSIGLYLHHFHRSDQDMELHGHPWSWALSFILAGGYREERRIGHRVISRVVPPLSFNFLRAEDYHRVDILSDDAWSLFLVGPKIMSWCFWNRETGKITPWREFLAAKQRGAQNAGDS